jgi:hypothetical protein
MPFVIQGSDALMARFRAIAATGPMMRQVALAGVQEAKALVPRKTGNLARTIRVGPVSERSLELHAGGLRGVGYAAAVELGSGPHVIVPRTKKVLAWGGARRLSGSLRKGAKATHFARRVNHPGSRPKPYLLPGLERAVGRVGPDGIIAAWNKGA